MPLKMDWVGRGFIERITRIRLQCYGSREGDFDAFKRRSDNGRFVDGDVCIASDNGVDVGTATSLSLQLHVRGKRLPCQGVAWVGASKSHRRRPGNERGVASQVMDALLQKARERGEVASALMPFRVSFYEHFGYGLVERQNIWTIPLTILPSASDTAWRFGTDADKAAMVECRRRQAERGMCDIETSPAAAHEWLSYLGPDTQLFVDDRAGEIVAYTWVRTIVENDRTIAVTVQPAFVGLEGLRSVLSLFASLKDQYGALRITLPTDMPINWLLKERQTPHRPVEHPAPTCKLITRMQVRVLDHVAFLQGQRLVRGGGGRVTVAVHESEGDVSTFTLDLSGDLIHAQRSSAAADITVRDVTWASIACGELRASAAASLGLIDVHNAEAIRTLDVLADGAAPFCYEYF
jgi:predicted acetyltransferase